MTDPLVLKVTLDMVRDWIADPFADVTLTDREREVIGLASHGIPVVFIANRIGTQRQSVYEAIRRALSKINATRGCDLDLDTLCEYVFGQLERIVS